MLVIEKLLLTGILYLALFSCTYVIQIKEEVFEFTTHRERINDIKLFDILKRNQEGKNMTKRIKKNWNQYA